MFKFYQITNFFLGGGGWMGEGINFLLYPFFLSFIPPLPSSITLNILNLNILNFVSYFCEGYTCFTLRVIHFQGKYARPFIQLAGL